MYNGNLSVVSDRRHA